ncbi:hypothetical protein TNCT_169561 [Trichonephila clavata]|uniref:Uncharacterized protein n=1 Tax=Trichonephila clavata TaxID=2740835 RepID=A0A8X6IS67_TRICU|nr:hypothetical protein TNCT_169561 [Trichonephila clavata]
MPFNAMCLEAEIKNDSRDLKITHLHLESKRIYSDCRVVVAMGEIRVKNLLARKDFSSVKGKENDYLGNGNKGTVLVTKYSYTKHRV